MLVINRYTCPINNKVSIQAHLIENSELVKSWGKMDVTDINIFSSHDSVLICDVVRASKLKEVNLIKGSEL